MWRKACTLQLTSDYCENKLFWCIQKTTCTCRLATLSHPKFTQTFTAYDYQSKVSSSSYCISMYLCRMPKSNCFNSPSVKSLAKPLPLLVLFTVASWRRTACPSLVITTSTCQKQHSSHSTCRCL